MIARIYVQPRNALTSRVSSHEEVVLALRKQFKRTKVIAGIRVESLIDLSPVVDAEWGHDKIKKADYIELKSKDGSGLDTATAQHILFDNGYSVITPGYQNPLLSARQTSHSGETQ